MSEVQFAQTVAAEEQWREEIEHKHPSLKSWPGRTPSGESGNGCEPSIAPNTTKETHMPNINEMMPSNYLKQSDFPDPLIVTVRGIEKKNIAMDGKPADYKWLCKFAEFEKPMVLNTTNIQLMAKACGSDNTDDWPGKEVIVYVDENVSFGGELVGGLRVRKYQANPTPARRQAPSDDFPQ